MTRRGSLAPHRSTVIALAVCLTAVVFLTLAAPSAQASKLSRDKARAKAITQEIAALDQRLAGLVSSYAAASAELEAVNEQIDRNRKLVAEAEAELEEARALVGERAVALYKERPVTLIDVIAGSSSFSEMLTQLQFMVKVSQHDEQMLADLEQMQREVAQRRQRLLADREAARTAMQRKQDEQARVEAALAERKSTLSGLRSEIRRLEASLRRPVVTSSPSAAGASGDASPPADAPSGGWWPLIQQAATANGIDPNGMYRLMMSESGGQPGVVGAGLYYGLFQYCHSTWNASWNPYRATDIRDGAAQIKATALALKMGKGPYWWPNTYGPAFSGT
ncbi:MAG: transglycosylase SLT domain-containing protein [Actinobacteria bacterium]|nr:transglycosylase SLT domain-containing protein [Actinomycetota bacterium]